MKKLALAAAIVASQALALSAFAQEKSRADVKAEAASATKAGEIRSGDKPPEKQPKAKSTAARPAVKADTAAAAKAGKIEKGEATAPENTAKPTSTAAKADVKKDAAAATKSGAIPRGEAATK